MMSLSFHTFDIKTCNLFRLPLHWDPRNASRTPSAKKMPHLRFRYDVPINACMFFLL